MGVVISAPYTSNFVVVTAYSARVALIQAALIVAASDYMDASRTLPTLVRSLLFKGALNKFRGSTAQGSEIGEIEGVYADTVGRWLKLDRNSLKVNHGGRKVGEARTLTPEQEKRIRLLLVYKTPDQLMAR